MRVLALRHANRLDTCKPQRARLSASAQRIADWNCLAMQLGLCMPPATAHTQTKPLETYGRRKIAGVSVTVAHPRS